MKFKLEENFGARTANIFQAANQDVLAVRDQKLQGWADLRLYKVCCAEEHCLVTLNLDFADITSFNPEKTKGIFVIRVPRNPTLILLENLIYQFLQSLSQMPVARKLWIVEVGRIQIHDLEDDAEP